MAGAHVVAYRINYSDKDGAGDYDYNDYSDLEAAKAEARRSFTANDMEWALTAAVFAIDANDEPTGECIVLHRDGRETPGRT